MVICMGGLQVFVVRFFFQVCTLACFDWSSINGFVGRKKGIRVNDLDSETKGYDHKVLEYKTTRSRKRHFGNLVCIIQAALGGKRYRRLRLCLEILCDVLMITKPAFASPSQAVTVLWEGQYWMYHHCCVVCIQKHEIMDRYQYRAFTSYTAGIRISTYSDIGSALRKS